MKANPVQERMYRKIPCPFCKVPAGMPCVMSMSGEPRKGGHSHDQRQKQSAQVVESLARVEVRDGIATVYLPKHIRTIKIAEL
jgi:hypothetical protein